MPRERNERASPPAQWLLAAAYPEPGHMKGASNHGFSCTRRALNAGGGLRIILIVPARHSPRSTHVIIAAGGGGASIGDVAPAQAFETRSGQWQARAMAIALSGRPVCDAIYIGIFGDVGVERLNIDKADIAARSYVQKTFSTEKA